MIFHSTNPNYMIKVYNQPSMKTNQFYSGTFQATANMIKKMKGTGIAVYKFLP